MLNQVAEGVGVRQSAWVLSKAIVVRAEWGWLRVDGAAEGTIRGLLDEPVDDLTTGPWSR